MLVDAYPSACFHHSAPGGDDCICPSSSFVLDSSLPESDVRCLYTLSGLNSIFDGK